MLNLPNTEAFFGANSAENHKIYVKKVKYLKKYEMKYKKQLSKQAKKDKAINKANASSFQWEDDL